MAKFLNTSATNYYLEDLIKATTERLIIISPFLKFNDRIRELLEDKDRMKIDVSAVRQEPAVAARNQVAALPHLRAHQLLPAPPRQVLPPRADRHHHLDESL